MKPKFGRKIALLTLPILIIGGVVVWNSKMKGWSGFGVPRGLYEGMPHLVITDWKPETPSALDFARGISSRWKVTTWGGGSCRATGKPLTTIGILPPTNLYFAWRRGGKWHRTPFKTEKSEWDVSNSGDSDRPLKREVRLGLPLDLVPRDAQEVRLRGRFDGWTTCNIGSVNSPSAPIDKVIKAQGEVWPKFAGSRVSPLKFVTTKQNRSPSSRDGTAYAAFWEVTGVFSYSGDSTEMNINDSQSWIEDAKGKRVLDVESNPGPSLRGGKGNPTWMVDTTKLKGHTGPFTLKSGVYVDLNEWPLQVSIPLKIGKP